MKNKKKTYTLLMTLVVILIWGKLIYDFFSLQNANTYPVSTVISTQEFIPDKQEKFDYIVAVDYRDPFLGKRPKNNNPKPVPTRKKTNKKEVKKPSKNLVWPKISYKGLMNNKSQKHGIGIFEINGKETLMRKGESKYQMTLILLARDSVQFMYREDTKTIKK